MDSKEKRPRVMLIGLNKVKRPLPHRGLTSPVNGDFAFFPCNNFLESHESSAQFHLASNGGRRQEEFSTSSRHLIAGNSGSKSLPSSKNDDHNNAMQKTLILRAAALSIGLSVLINPLAYASKQPAARPSATRPIGVTGQCRDGTYSYARHHQGMCSRHHGVLKFFN